MSIYDFSQYFPQSGLLSQPGFSQQQGLLGRMDPWTSEYQQAAGTPGLFGHQTPELPTWQQQKSFLPDWDKMFPKGDDNGNGNGTGAIPGSDKDKDLKAGRRRHPSMYDEDDMWVGAEGKADSGVAWQDSPLAGLIGKWGIDEVPGPHAGWIEKMTAANNAAAAGVDGPTQAEVSAAQAASDSGVGQLGDWF